MSGVLRLLWFSARELRWVLCFAPPKTERGAKHRKALRGQVGLRRFLDREKLAYNEQAGTGSAWESTRREKRDLRQHGAFFGQRGCPSVVRRGPPLRPG